MKVTSVILKIAVLLFVFISSSTSATANQNEAIFVKPETKGVWGTIFDKFYQGPTYGKTFALVVGVSEYSELEDLPTDDDPWEIAKFLVDEAGYDHVQVLTNEAVTENRVRDVLQTEFQEKMGKNDRLLIYWSGHGITKVNRIDQKVGFLALGSSDPDSIGSLVKMRDLMEWVEFIPANQVLIILDACFSGLIGSASMGKTDRLLKEITRPSFEIIAAGSADQTTFAAHSLGGGAFTRAILEGLRGAADTASGQFNKDGIISTTELILYARKRIIVYAEDGNWDRRIRPSRTTLLPNYGEFFFLSQDGKIAALEKSGHEVASEIVFGIPTHQKKDTISEPLIPMSGSASRSLQRCNQVASSTDYSGNYNGANIPFFNIPPTEALVACELAYQTSPNSPRATFQYLRSLYRYALNKRDQSRYLAFSSLAESKCSDGQNDACYLLARSYALATFFKENDSAKALNLYDEACGLGHRAACLGASNARRNGYGTSSDPEAAYVEASRLCEQNYGDACVSQSYSLAYGLGVDSDPSTAYELALKYCEEENASACNRIAYMLQDGLGIAMNDQAATAYFNKSCDLGSADSCNRVAYDLWRGRGVEKNHDGAVQILKGRCDASDFEACTYVGFIFERSLPSKSGYDAARNAYELSCENGDTLACSRLGYLLEKGLGVEIDYDLMKFHYEQSCNRNDGRGCIRLAYLYRDGIGVEIDLPKANTIFEHLCSTGNQEACTAIGYLHERGVFFERDYLKASKIYQSACNLSYSWACSRLGNLFWSGNGLEKDLRSAYSYFSQGCDLGNFWGCNSQGRFLRDGIGVQEDDPAALSLFEKTCHLGDSTSCGYAGYMYESTQGTVQNYERAFQFYKIGCERKDGWSCGRLASLHFDARGIIKDVHTAFNLFSEGCDLGNDWSCQRTGTMYRDGNGTRRDLNRAHEIFKELCDGGNEDGCTYLANLYERGLGVDQDHEYAVKAYTESCDKGTAWACGQLADAYRYGEGVNIDDELAFGLYERACNSGHNWSCRRLSDAYRDGYTVSQDRAKALEIVRATCDKGDADSCYKAGQLAAQMDPILSQQLLSQACEKNVSQACVKLAELLFEEQGDKSNFVGILSRDCETGGARSCARLGDYYLRDTGNELILDAYSWYAKGCILNDEWSCQAESELLESEDELRPFLFAREGCEAGRHRDCIMALTRLDHPLVSQSGVTDLTGSPIRSSQVDEIALSLLEPIKTIDKCVRMEIGPTDLCILFASLPLIHNKSDEQMSLAVRYLEKRCAPWYTDGEACRILHIWMLSNTERAAEYRQNHFERITNNCEKYVHDENGDEYVCYAPDDFGEVIQKFSNRIDWDYWQSYLLKVCEENNLTACLPLFTLENSHARNLKNLTPATIIRRVLSVSLDRKSQFFCSNKLSFSEDHTKILQKVLVERGNSVGQIDGIWGAKTSAAIQNVVGCMPFDRPGTLNLEEIIR